MAWKRMFSITAHELKKLGTGQKLTALFIIPFLIVSIVGYCFQNAYTEVSVNIIDLDAGSAVNSSVSVSKAMISLISKEDSIHVQKIYHLSDIGSDPLNTSLDQLRAGNIQGIIFFSSNFTNEVLSAIAKARSTPPVPVMPPGLNVYVDGSNPSVGNIIVGVVQKDVQILLASQYHVSLPVRLNAVSVNASNTTMFDFTGPGFACLVAMLFGFMFTAVSFITESPATRKSLSPEASEFELIGGCASSSAIVAVVQSSLIIGTLMLFSIKMEGSPYLVVLILTLLMMVAQAMAFVIGTLAKDLRPVIFSLPVILFPSIVLTGLIFPVYMVGPVLRPFSYIIPMTYAVDGCRAVMIKGSGPGDVWLQILILIIFEVLILSLGLAIIKFRKKSPARNKATDH